MECDVCKKKERVVLCDGCASGICIKCSKLTASEIKVLELKGSRVMKFYCTRCTQFETNTLLQKMIEDKNNIISSKDEIIALLKKQVADLDTMKSQNLSYSSVVQQNLNGPSNPTPNSMLNNIPSLLIIPNKTQNVKTTKKDLYQHIKPADLKIRIKNTNELSKGGVIVKCHSKQDIEKLKTDAENKLSNNGYRVHLTKMRKPQFKIVGYDGDLNLDDIESCLRDQNDNIKENDDIEITYMNNNKKNGTRTIYGNCNAALFHRLLANKRIYLQWQSCLIYEDISVQRCFKCQDYFHKSQNCTCELRCGYCGGNHDYRECTKDQKHCINCEKANTKYGCKYDTKHEASDSKCPTYEYHIRILRSKINYSGFNG